MHKLRISFDGLQEMSTEAFLFGESGTHYLPI